MPTNVLELTELTIYAKAKIPVYQSEDGRLYTDAGTLTDPLFRLGDVKGDTGETGAAGADGAAGVQGVQGVKGNTGAPGADGAAGAQGVQGVKGGTGAAGADGAAGAQGVKGDRGDTGATGAAGANSIPAYKLTGSTLNTSRAGVVAGLDIQSVASAVALIGSVVIFRGLLKLVSSATGNGSFQVSIGGLVFTFTNIAIAASTQYVPFEVTANVLSAGVGFASVRQSIALNGVAANDVQANNVVQSGSSSTNTALIQFKSPATTQVTTLLAVCEVL